MSPSPVAMWWHRGGTTHTHLRVAWAWALAGELVTRGVPVPAAFFIAQRPALTEVT
jgi:hypothetical protein